MSFDQLMIHYSAPSFCGIKPANMFSVSKEVFCRKEYENWEERFSLHGLESFFIELSGTRILMFVYNKSWTERILSVPYVKKYLEGKGYDYSGRKDFFSMLKTRLDSSSDFPHEIGIVLGYPVEDVIAFEKCSGKNCKYCGAWKCYSDVDNARNCENRFRECSRLCSRWFDEGCSVTQIVKKYKEVFQAA